LGLQRHISRYLKIVLRRIFKLFSKPRETSDLPETRELDRGNL
jgi:hypothetical protein